MENKSTFSTQNINEKLNAAHGYLAEEFILNMATKSPEISNVVNALNRESFGIWTFEEGFTTKYTLSYINGEGTDLKGEVINLDLNDVDKFDITMAFCTHLCRDFVHLDIIDVFNTYSHKLRSYLEMHDNRTISRDELMATGENATFIAKAKGIYYVPIFDKLSFYRNFFGNLHEQPRTDNENVIYLLLDAKTGYFKIGRSTNIQHRERTLQAQLPVIETIAYWNAPKSQESFLHKTFSDKRLRGEWFKLTFKDLRLLQEIMSKY